MTVEPAPTLSRQDAERITTRIRLVAGNVREGMEKLHLLVGQAKAGGAPAALGFASWTAYLSDVLGSEPMRLDRESRRELVDYLASEGMSTRAIAPIVGVHRDTVATDIAARRVGNPTPGGSALDAASRALGPDPIAEARERAMRQASKWSTSPDPVGVDGGEAVAPTAPSPVTVAAPAPAPPAVEVAGPTASATTPPAKRATVTGLDGKTYPRPALVPPPARDYAQENAEAHCRELANALDVLWALTIPEAFERSFADWAVGAIGARPSARERRTPTTLRAIADALNNYADHLEGLAS